MEKEEFVSLAQDYLNLWDCIPDGEFFFTHSSLLWAVKRSDEKCMLKIVDPDDDEARAAEMLKFFGGRGAVRLVEDHGNVQLMERVCDHADRPTLEGMVLSGDDDAATRIICDVIGQLHTAIATKRPPVNLKPFQKRTDDMRRHVEKGRVRPEERPVFRIACDLSDDLITEAADNQMSLHGDIHHGNVLRSAHRGWLAIDPKGISGPRAYEYANSLCNPYGHAEIVANPARMARQASIMSERSEVSRDQLLRFTFLHAMQCGAWSLSGPDQAYWRACARTAAKLANISL